MLRSPGPASQLHSCQPSRIQDPWGLVVFCSSSCFSVCFFHLHPIKKRNLAPKKHAILKKGAAFQPSLSGAQLVVARATGLKMFEQLTPTSMSLCAANWSAGSKYEHKRSKTLLKVKTFYDEDLFFALVMKEVAFTKRLMSSDATVRKCWYPGFLLNFYQIGTKCRGPKRPIDSVN